MKATITSWVILSTLILTGCNTTSSEVQPEYVSSFKYKNSSCVELENELLVIEQRTTEAVNEVDSKAISQDTKLALGWLFFPSYFIIDDNQPEAKKLAKIKGEYSALKEAMRSKHCG